MSRAEVWWYEHPDAQRRPFLILTRDEACQVLNQVLAAPATTVVRGLPTEISVDQTDGMPRACVFNLDNVTQIRPALCTDRITRLDEARMAQACRALGVSLDCKH